MRDQDRKIGDAISDYFIVLMPPIFFGTAILLGPVVVPLQVITVLGLLGLVKNRINTYAVHGALLWFLVVIFFLSIGVLLASHGNPDLDDVKQFSMRSLFAFYTFALFVRLVIKKKISREAVKAALLTLRIFFLYGVYEFLAKIVDLPLPLSGLSNNPSYTNALEVTSDLSGWLEFYRAQSIWPEPSFAIFPVILFWVLSDGERIPVKKIDMIIMFMFVLLTFSRTVWLGLFVIIVARSVLFKSRPWVLVIGLIFSLSLAFLNFSDGNDHSASVRAETTRYGFEIASKDFYKGIGFNKFKDTEYAEISEESVIHNTVSSYLASMGWPIGLALLLLFIVPLLKSRVRDISYLAPLLVILLFTMSDAFYFTPVYFLIAYGRAKNLSTSALVSPS
ncbi:O-antigen ligase family protein [Comamonas composti]|uniref:O-antigen ligase family protein n=1 Tax=Comamonas composti TaxID=408558 RepID=UPI0012EBC7F6|nr:O-antigen ligase family protein [Comamonas composti]